MKKKIIKKLYIMSYCLVNEVEVWKMRKVEREKRFEVIILLRVKKDDRLEKLGIGGEMLSK